MKIGLTVGYILCGLILLSACLIPWASRHMYLTAMAKLDDPGSRFQHSSSSKNSGKSSPPPIDNTETPQETESDAPPESSEAAIPTLPPMVSFTPREDGDFLSDETRFKEFTEHLYAYRFKDIKDMVDAYMTENSPPKSDTAYQVLDILQTFNAVALLAKCERSGTDAEAPVSDTENTPQPTESAVESEYIYYNGLSSLTTGGALVPYISTTGGNYVRVGYMSSKNVVYGGYTLTSGSGVVATGSLPGWNLEGVKNAPAAVPAAADVPIRLEGATHNDAKMETLLASSQITVRYTVDGLAVKSYEVTQKEQEALSAIYALCRTQAMLLDVAAQ